MDNLLCYLDASLESSHLISLLASKTSSGFLCCVGLGRGEMIGLREEAISI